MRPLGLLLGTGLVSTTLAGNEAPVFMWFEPEWFVGVEGAFGYWSGAAFKATGSWGVAGPGVTAEWSTGGESEVWTQPAAEDLRSSK
jgi:hypothetical protein